MKNKKGFNTEVRILILTGILIFLIPLASSFMINRSRIISENLTGQILFLIMVGVAVAGIASFYQVRSLREQRTNREGELIELIVKQDLEGRGPFITQAINLELELVVKDVILEARPQFQGTNFKENTIRANIMLIDPKDKENLYIKYHINMRNLEEINLHWKKGHGCAGLAWDDKKQLIADLTLIPQMGQPDWRIESLDHIKLTKELASIISTPIFHPQNMSEVLGILNVDSIYPLSLTGFDNPKVYTDLQEKAVVLASLLIHEQN